MAMRFERKEGRKQGVWSFLCRMASEFRRLDVRDRDGRPSWDPIASVKTRHSRLAATIVGVNLAGGPIKGTGGIRHYLDMELKPDAPPPRAPAKGELV